MRAESVPSRAECPEPGRWTAPDEWASESEVSIFMGELVRLIKPDFVVETGTYLGFTAERIGWALGDLGRGRLVSLEVSPERVKQAQAQVGDAGSFPVDVRLENSLTYEPDAPIDLLFVDSGFSDRMKEVRRFARWASPRCVVVCHDPAVPASYPGVPAFVQDMQDVVAEGVVHPWFYLPTPRGLALTRYR